jgi:DNA-binding beta-propeller fold protein YncE
VSEFKSNGTAISGSAGYTAGGLDAPQGIAIDGSGSIWVANQNSSILSEIVGAAAPVVTPIDTATRTSKLGQRP